MAQDADRRGPHPDCRSADQDGHGDAYAHGYSHPDANLNARPFRHDRPANGHQDAHLDGYVSAGADGHGCAYGAAYGNRAFHADPYVGADADFDFDSCPDALRNYDLDRRSGHRLVTPLRQHGG